MPEVSVTERVNPIKTTRQLDEQEIAELKIRWKHCADKLVQVTNPKSKFVINKKNKEIVEGLFWWFFNDPRSCYDLKKGILLKGTKGTGKTTLLRSFRNFFIEQGCGFMFETAMKITLEYAKSGEINQWVAPRLVAIDEIGRENIAKYYGNELNVLQYILHERYSIWQNTGICTIATTNFDSEEIQTAYSEVIRDRVKEMFTHIPMVGDSLRK